MLFVLPIFGQFSAGPRLGANFSTVTVSWSDQDDLKTKWIGGLTAGALGNSTFYF